MKALAILLLATTCACASPPARMPDPDRDACVIRGTLLRDTIIDADLDSLTIVTGVGMSLRNAHAIDPRAPVVFPGDVLFVRCHEDSGRMGLNGKRSARDTVVDSLDVLLRPEP